MVDSTLPETEILLESKKETGTENRTTRQKSNRKTKKGSRLTDGVKRRSGDPFLVAMFADCRRSLCWRLPLRA